MCLYLKDILELEFNIKIMSSLCKKFKELDIFSAKVDLKMKKGS